MRKSLTAMGLFALGFVAIFAYMQATRPEVAQPVATDPSTPATAAAADLTAPPAEQPAAVEQAPPAPEPAPGPPQAASAETVAQWSADLNGTDAAKRAAAIAAMASVPKEQAVPVLQGVLISGERQVDRPLALRTLRTLAERQGDEDGHIRDAVRHAIYHGDDDATTQAAQETLGQIENDLAVPKARTRG
jgi:hypothetical protein